MEATPIRSPARNRFIAPPCALASLFESLAAPRAHCPAGFVPSARDPRATSSPQSERSAACPVGLFCISRRPTRARDSAATFTQALHIRRCVARRDPHVSEHALCHVGGDPIDRK